MFGNAKAFIFLVLLVGCTLFCTAQTIKGLPKRQKRIQIPFQYVNNFIIVKVKINGLPMHFILDSGASQTIITKKTYSKHLSVNYKNKVTFYGSDLLSKLHAYPIANTDIALNNIAFTQQMSYVLEEDYLALETFVGMPIQGILSMNHFDNLVLEINYKKKLITISEPNKIDYKAYSTIAFTMEGNLPYINSLVTLQNKDSIFTKILIDTGANLSLMLHNETHPKLALPTNFIEGKFADGLGGQVNGFIGRLNQFTFGNEIHKDIICHFQALPKVKNHSVFKNRNGLVGNKLLSLYDVVFDFYYNEMKLLRKRKCKGNKFDKSGLAYYATGEKLNSFIIENVIENSAAAMAGIEKGDEILKVNKASGNYLNLNIINAKLQKKAGTKIKMTIRRNGKKLRKQFRLKDLI